MGKTINTALACAALAALLAACSSDKEAEPLPQVQAIEKAKGTEKMLQDAEEARRKQMEEQGI